jgi:hypothetical protein
MSVVPVKGRESRKKETRIKMNNGKVTKENRKRERRNKFSQE